MYLLIMLIPILIIYPFFISKYIDKHTITKEPSIKQITKNIGLISLISIISIIVISYLLNIYYSLIPSSTSSLCTNTGGWTYSCQGDTHTAPILLAAIGLVIIAYHFLSQKFVYKIFEYSKGVFKYIYMYIHMFIIYFLNFWLLLYLYGLFISVHYDSVLIELLRFFVFISPTCLFIISTLIYAHKNKNN